MAVLRLSTILVDLTKAHMQQIYKQVKERRYDTSYYRIYNLLWCDPHSAIRKETVKHKS